MESGDHAPCVWQGDPDEIVATRAELARVTAERDEARKDLDLALKDSERIARKAAGEIGDLQRHLTTTEAERDALAGQLADMGRRLDEAVEIVRAYQDDHRTRWARRGVIIDNVPAAFDAEGDFPDLALFRRASLVNAEKEGGRG